MKDFQKISSLLKANVIATEDPPVDKPVQSEVDQRWLKCAGRAALWSHPILFTSGRLVVFTQSPIWATELRHNLRQIQQGLDGLGITKIDIRTSPGNFQNARKPGRRIVLSDDNRKNLRLTAKGLKHQGMRDALIRLSQERNKPSS